MVRVTVTVMGRVKFRDRVRVRVKNEATAALPWRGVPYPTTRWPVRGREPYGLRRQPAGGGLGLQVED